MEKDLAIYYEMRSAAERVFNEGINAPAGVYSLAELAKVGKICKTAPEGVCFRKDYKSEELININVDGFECSYPASLSFVLAYKFERLAKVVSKERAVFHRVEDYGEPVAVFTLDAVTVENLAACEDPRKGFRPQMQGVFCDIAAGLSCCCDGHALNVARLADAQVMAADELENGGVILSRAFAKSAKDCKVSIYKDGENLRAVASNGASCAAIAGLYPNYKTVFSHVDESRPVKLYKNAKDLQKACVTVANTADGANVFLSGLNADGYITISANGKNGEISRRVALAAPLTFNFFACCKAANIKCVNGSSNTLYIAQSGQIVLTGEKTLSLLSPCCFCESDLTQTAAAAYQLTNQGKYNFNIFAAFAAPSESIQTADSTDTLDVTPAVSTDSIQEADSTDTLDVTPAVSTDSIQATPFFSVLSNVLKVAAVFLLVFVLRSVLTIGTTADTLDVTPAVSTESIQAADSTDTLDVTPAVSTDSIQAADSTDTLDVTPAVPTDSIQAADSTGTLDVTPAVSTDSIQAADSTGTLDVTPAVSTDSIQAADSTDTLDVTPAVPTDSIQAADSTDTLDVTPAVPTDSIQAADSTDTLDVTPAVSTDSIQAADSTDTLDVTPAVSTDSIQESDSTDTLDAAPVAPAKNPYIIDSAKN